VAVRASLADPGAVVAGLVAPLVAGVTVLLPGDTDATGTHAVASGATVPEPERIDPGVF